MVILSVMMILENEISASATKEFSVFEYTGYIHDKNNGIRKYRFVARRNLFLCKIIWLTLCSIFDGWNSIPEETNSLCER